MNFEDKKALIQHRINNARETIAESETLYKQGFYSGVVNRSYYAIFYATLAILLTKGLGKLKT